MGVRSRLARLGDRMFDRLRHPAAFSVSDDGAVDGDFDSLRGRPYALLVTFRRDGTPVPSPVWFALDSDGRAYVKTVTHAGKSKRVRNNGSALLAPSTMRGKPVGPAVRGTARLLAAAEWGRAEEALASAYGMDRRIFERLLGEPDEDVAYLEVTPRG
ncbi:MAG TPA: PPOX class F420-dependent oxidoreductase [Acidimicrobiia bacterium]|nr:PPOX class F420-dependent oxidoreductase [Acidimicrobiia bacterium]